MACHLPQQMLCTVQIACHHNSNYRRHTLFAHLSAGIGHQAVLEAVSSPAWAYPAAT